MTTVLRFALFSAAAVSAALVGLPAAAQEATSDDWMRGTPAVVAASPSANPSANASASTSAGRPASTGLSREQVKAELRAARASGELARLNAEVVDPPQTTQRRPAAPVYAERR